MTPPRPPPRPDRGPIIAGDGQPARGAVRHSGVDGVEQAAPNKSPTLTRLPAVTGGSAQTLPAPSTTAQTVRATPATGIRTPDDETPSGEPPGPAAELDLRSALAAAEKRNAELERRERVRVEAAGPNSWPPKVQRSQSPVPSSTPEAKTDRAIGGLVRALLARFGWPALAAIGIGGAALKPTADPAKQDAALIGQEELTRKIDRLGTKLDGVIDREATRDDFLICLYEQQADYFAQLLPSQERLVAAQPLRTWVDRCRNRKPPR